MRTKALILFILTLTFALAPFFVPFSGFDPDLYPQAMIDPMVQPAGYAFSIWGVIYLWLIAMAAFGLFKRAADPDWDAVRLPMMLSLGAGVPWLSIAMVSPLWATALIWVMLLTALWAVTRLPRKDIWSLAVPVGLYAGWLTAASSVSIGLVMTGWGIPPFGEMGWAIVSLSVALVIATFVLSEYRAPAYGVAVIWALVAVLVQNGLNVVGIFAVAGAAVLTVLSWRSLTNP